MGKKHADKYRLIGKAISEYRQKKEITQKELADKIGVSLSYISKIEAPNSKKSFSLEILLDIADELDVSIHDLLKYIKWKFLK